ncbi:unnamed protein product [Timema podura]|uniref:HTH psq-type domain-containing protein n=1 Tax=Timema podura TaxID=61482 RepID=A0ABN7NK86_TIMPD|nr:unnamed protein product [Timema podura]
MKAVQRGQLSQRAASERYGVPRRTVRNHLKTEMTTKILGRNSVITKEQETKLVERIVEFASIALSKVWSKYMTYGNIISGFRATGLYPFNPDAIPEEAFAPSLLTESPDPHSQNKYDNEIPLANLKTKDSLKSPFHELMPTPNYAVVKAKPRRKALNYQSQRVTKELSKVKVSREKTNKQGKTKKNKGTNRPSKDGWYCHGCRDEKVAGMRQCSQCLHWYHEECVGLTKEDHQAVDHGGELNNSVYSNPSSLSGHLQDKGSKYQSNLNEIDKSEQKSSVDSLGKGIHYEWPQGDSGCALIIVPQGSWCPRRCDGLEKFVDLAGTSGRLHPCVDRPTAPRANQIDMHVSLLDRLEGRDVRRGYVGQVYNGVERVK